MPDKVLLTMYEVHFWSRVTGRGGCSEPQPREASEAALKAACVSWPDLEHWLVPVSYTASGVVSDV